MGGNACMSLVYLPEFTGSDMGYQQHSKSADGHTGRSVTSSAIPTVSKSSKQECGVAVSTTPRYGQILKHSTGIPGLDAWICALVDFPAKTSAPVESVPELMGSEADYGPKCSELFARFDPDSRSLKTSRLSDTDGWVYGDVLGTWPASGWMRNGQCYRLPPLDPPTFGKEFSFLPTPTVTTSRNLNFCLRAHETWETTSNLGALLLGMESNLTGRTAKPSGGYVVRPAFIEWMMGFEPGWTGLKPLETRSFRDVLSS